MGGSMHHGVRARSHRGGTTSSISRTSDALTSTVRFVESSLRAATTRLDGAVVVEDVHAVEQAMDEAQRLLGPLTVDPWDQALGPLRQAREVLSSHLLAADACTSADVAPAITAQVLQRGADHARWVLSAWCSDNGA